MKKYYSAERNIQIVISLMKAHGIRYVVASPGATNVTFVASLQQDSYFKIFSSVDERSAAYIACGIAAETGEPVALSCTGATASRNYMPGLTEAFYRKLPILAITSTQHTGRIGSMTPQVIDRFNLPNDIAKLSIQIPTVISNEDEWACTVQVNRAILELTHNGCGPVHINLSTTYSSDFSVKELPLTRVIRRYGQQDKLPEISCSKVGIFVGAHQPWTPELIKAVDLFCEKYNGAVFCDHTSNYTGKYKVLFSLSCRQNSGDIGPYMPDLLIHIGEISADYALAKIGIKAQVWRVSPDGKICDYFRQLTNVFEMNESLFFQKYTNEKCSECNTEFFQSCITYKKEIDSSVPELPFSNPWIAQQIAGKLPAGAVLHLGILNSIRSWSCFDVPPELYGYANTGGFGIDGCMSSMIGASMVSPEKLFFGVFGDLAFFYDLNVLGNRHVGKNLRILLINNGIGTEFKNYDHQAARFGDSADLYLAAAGHYGNQSQDLVKNFSTNLGFKYLTASSKKDFTRNISEFLSPECNSKSIIFEVFTNSKDESDAIQKLSLIKTNYSYVAKQLIADTIGPAGVNAIKKILKK